MRQHIGLGEGFPPPSMPITLKQLKCRKGLSPERTNELYLINGRYNLSINLGINLGNIFNIGTRNEIWLDYNIHHHTALFETASQFAPHYLRHIKDVGSGNFFYIPLIANLYD